MASGMLSSSRSDRLSVAEKALSIEKMRGQAAAVVLAPFRSWTNARDWMSKLLKQVAALPVMETAGTPHVLLLTSRGSQRWITPKVRPEKRMQAQCSSGARGAGRSWGIRKR
jgi:hypothetical protein